MSGFGDRLRAEREAQGRSIEEISTSTGIYRAYLEALESEEFHALPGRAFGKLYIRACAEVLGLDPRPLIEEYDRARAAALGGEPAQQAEAEGPRRAETAIARWRHQLAGRREARSRSSLPISEPADGAAPPAALMTLPEPPPDVTLHTEPPAVESGHPPAGSVATRGLRPAVAAFVFLGLFGAAAAVYFTLTRRLVEANAPAGQMSAPPVAPPAAAPRLSADAVPQIAGPSLEPPPKPISPPPSKALPSAPTSPSALSIQEWGVGRRVAARRLLEPAGSFPEGSAVAFSTRVIGGEPGERIHHVWIREGRTMQSISLRIGGRDWRTYSRKTVYGAGRWAVEARDDSGRVLARAEFTCVPEAP